MAAQAQAQDQDEGQAEEQTGNQIVVTATKREVSLGDVPATITAFDSEQIALTEITTNNDLQFTVPGLVAGYFNGSSQLTLRGIGANSSTGIDDPAVAQHIDGVYQTRTQAVALALTDVQRIEVLKGPQGTLYGRNSTGGAVNYVTNKPTDEFEGSIRAVVGNQGRLGGQIILSGPLTDTLSARGNFYYNEQDGYVDIVGGGGSPDLFAEETIAGRIALRFEPTSDLTFDLSYSTIENETVIGAQLVAVVNPAAAGFLLPGTFSTEINELVSEENPTGEISQDSFAATIDWSFGDGWNFKSITGYSENEFSALGVDVDYSASPFFRAAGDTANESESFSQELNLSYSGDGIDVVTGLFYLDDSFDQALGFPAFGLLTTFNQESEAFALFADATVSVSDRFRVLGGIRYNTEEKEVTQTSTLACPTPVSGRERWSSTNPKFGLQYDVGDDAMVYGTWQEGFKAGGFDPADCISQFNPEEIEAIEIGLKATLFDGDGLLNIALFDYNYSDLQVQQLEGFVTVIQNAGRADVRGFDVEFQYGLTDELRVELSGSYLDTEVNDLFLNDPFAAPGTPAVDVSGSTLRRAPEFSGTFALNYDAGFSDGSELQLRGELFVSDDIRFRFFDNEPAAFQDSYVIGNLYANFRPSFVDGLAVRAFVKNVGNERTLQGVIPFGAVGLQLGNYTRGRTYGLEASFDF
ncbi:MAG: TonB-dependent receptor [Pseudomonadota bacterium]